MYINSNTKEYPYSISRLKKDNPQVSFPVTMDDGSLMLWGVYPVRNTYPPLFDSTTQKIIELLPIEVNGEWIQQWGIEEIPADEVEASRAAAAQALQQSIVDATQDRLDNFARTRNYDGILSACTYATSSIPKFAAEGQSAVNLRDATWAALYQILEDVQSGRRNPPTGFQDIESDLPALEWPV